MIVEAPDEQNWIQKNTVENVKHFKIQLLFNNPKIYSSCDQYPQNTDSPNSKPKKTLKLIPVCKYAKSTPWILKQKFDLASAGILPEFLSTENANEYYFFNTIVQGYINQIWMVNNCTLLKSSQCLGVTKLHPSNFTHFFQELLKRWLGRQNGFIHVPKVS